MSPWLIWFVAGIALAFLELQMPGFIVIFFGIGCWVVAGALLLWDLTMTQQFMLFSAATIASIVLLRQWFMRIFRGRTDKTDREFDDFPQGERVTVLQRISPTQGGRVKYRGTSWEAVVEGQTVLEPGDLAELLRYLDNNHNVFVVRKI